MIFWILVGIAIGYFFKPQIDPYVKKAIRYLREKSNKDYYNDDDNYGSRGRGGRF